MKTAIVFFSLEGNTRSVAAALADALHADVIELHPQKPYPTGAFSKFFAGGKSASLQEVPKLSPYSFNAAAYDLVVLGTPLWAWNITPPLRTFLRENDLSRAKVAAFICSGGGNPEKAFAAIRKEAHCASLAAEMTVVNALKDKKAAAEQILNFSAALTAPLT